MAACESLDDLQPVADVAFSPEIRQATPFVADNYGQLVASGLYEDMDGARLGSVSMHDSVGERLRHAQPNVVDDKLGGSSPSGDLGNQCSDLAGPRKGRGD